jgi:hypothetical protein
MTPDGEINIFRSLELVMLIPLTNSDAAVIVDYDDYESLSKWSWYLHRDGSAVRRKSLGDGSRTSWIQRMHREICGIDRKDKRVVDHKNGNRLDNRKINLRVCSQGENLLNCRVRKHSGTGLKGVARTRSGWIAYIRHSGRKKHLGSFSSAELAYEFVSLARELLHGEYVNHG